MLISSRARMGSGRQFHAPYDADIEGDSSTSVATFVGVTAMNEKNRRTKGKPQLNKAAADPLDTAPHDAGPYTR